MNDLMAAGCMAELAAAGLRIPDDMAVADIDNREIAISTACADDRRPADGRDWR